MRVILIVLDSVGIGAAPDAADYGDEGANTLAHLARESGPLDAPTLQSLGLGNIPPLVPGGAAILGIPPSDSARACFGAMQEMSKGKDTTTGHWEIAGLLIDQGFHLFPRTEPCFPKSLISRFEKETGRKVIGNKHASGTVIISELGEEQMRDGSWIAYTSADSVFQIAAHEEVIPLDELYGACAIARGLCDELFVGRVIARPYVGAPGSFKRTENRRDYSLLPPEPTLLDRLSDAGIPVTTIGKIDDIYAHRGMTDTVHVENNADAQEATLELIGAGREGLMFINLIDFDMLYGHRRDAHGYARALEKTDRFLGELLDAMNDQDVLMITADHGNDPTFRGTDHTREYVPLLAYRAGCAGRSLGIRKGFFDIAQSVATHFGIANLPHGKSFLPL